MKIRCSNCFHEYAEDLGLCPNCGYSEGEPAAEAFCLVPGTKIAGRYIVGGRISSGGFGIVYKAWDQKLENIIAIKEYYPSGLVNRLPGETSVILVASRREKEFVYGKTRFLEEARNMAKFSSHKNIVNVYQFFEENNTAYIVMEFLSGETLSTKIQRNRVPLPYDYCVNIACEVCAALRAIHKENILHRDVSPDNIMICNDGNVKLFDFGAARFSAGIENRVTVVVKPGFAPPEQYDKVNRQDPRTDIYALGATLYYAMTRVRPEESTNRKIDDKLVEPCKIDDKIPQNISTAIMRAMAVEQQYRFSTVDEFEKALTSNKKVLSVQKERKKRKLRRIVGILVSFLLVAGAAGAFLLMLKQEKAAAGLPDAHLDIWYIQTGDDARDAAKVEAMRSIISTFTEGYDNVSIELLPVDSEGYEERLTEAFHFGNQPAIFESTELSDIDQFEVTDMSELISSSADIAYSQGKRSSMTVYPTGLIVPAIYVNTASGIDLTSVESIDQVLELCKNGGTYFVVKNSAVDMYAALFGEEVADYTTESALSEFTARKAALYFGDSQDYFEIQEALPGEYSLLMPSTSGAVYHYGTTWSMSTLAEDAEEAAAAIISYFSSDLAQDYFHLQNKSDFLPVTKKSLEKFIDIYPEWAPLEEYLDRPFVAPPETVTSLLSSADPSKLEELKMQPVEFADVSEDAWYSEAVSVVVRRGLMMGSSDGQFQPDADMSKSSVVTALYRLAGSPEATGAAPFTDVFFETEQGKAVAWAYASGVVSGTDDGLFNGNSSVNLETSMALFRRFAECCGLDLTASADLAAYPDANEVDTWAADGVKWGISHNILSVQEGGNITPKSEVSRGRFAVLLMRLCETYDER